LVPETDLPGYYPFVIPYQGYSSNYSGIGLHPRARMGHSASVGLVKYGQCRPCEVQPV
jgi:hypothetical protein